jgi:hypothetical protein
VPLVTARAAEERRPRHVMRKGWARWGAHTYGAGEPSADGGRAVWARRRPTLQRSVKGSSSCRGFVRTGEDGLRTLLSRCKDISVSA